MEERSKRGFIIRRAAVILIFITITGCIFYDVKLRCTYPDCRKMRVSGSAYCSAHKKQTEKEARQRRSRYISSRSTAKSSSSGKTYDPKYYYSPGVPRPECYVPGCHKLTEDKCGSYCKEHYYQYILKRKPSSGSTSSGKSSSAGSSSTKSSSYTDSYDSGYESIYEDDDYDEDRYYSDPDYASGVDDAMDELDW